MSVPLHPAIRASIAVVAVPLGLYLLFVGLAVTPFFQRHFLYAHMIPPLRWTNLNKPEKWGFAKNQVTPFGVDTPDGESLYAWHITPLPLYLQNEATIAAQPTGFAADMTTTESFRLLRGDPEARLIVSFHGNAGHVAQGHRPQSYHTLTDTSSYHVLTVDYRGFGHSSGVPSERGLITDGVALVDWAMHVAGIPPDRIVLLGQSLGTAVASGVAEYYIEQGVEFAGIVLVAGFSDLPTMLTEYRIGGLIPILSPFRASPALWRLFQNFMVDKWQSSARLTNIVRHTKNRLRLCILHAKNDRDIPWTEDNKLFKAAVIEKIGFLDDDAFETWKEQRTIGKGDNAFVTTWSTEPNIHVRQELFPYGGHNNIMGFSPLALAIMRSFDLHGTTYE